MQDNQLVKMKWILFWVFVLIFVLAVLGTLGIVFFGFGTPTPEERSFLVKAFVGEIAAAVIALFYSIFKLKKSDQVHQNPQIHNEAESSKEISQQTADEVCSATNSSEQRHILETGGILQVLRERIMNRVIEHLDTSVRRYETLDAVAEGCKLLANRIHQDKFAPDIIIGWENPETGYHGSQKIANLMSSELGVPYRLLTIQEQNENRIVTGDYQWFRNIGRALIVDDACYSGNTLSIIQKSLSKITSEADIRFAVLSTQDPCRLPNMYYVSIHTTEELLFPWGWSRLIVGFSDIYKLFGISDLYCVWDQPTGWGTIHTIARRFIGNVRLLTVEPNREFQQGSNRDTDTFLYVVSGKIVIQIGDKEGSFMATQYLFIPRLVGYTLKTACKAFVLELSSGDNKEC